MRTLQESQYFAAHIHEGKKAIKHEHRNSIRDRRSNRIVQSIDFDLVSTKQKLEMKCRRWDYFVSTQSTPDLLIAIEVHKFDPTELLKKREDTKRILQNYCPKALTQIQSWHVIVTGETRSDLVSRFQADSGIKISRFFVTKA